jgi:hypothetical protein
VINKNKVLIKWSNYQNHFLLTDFDEKRQKPFKSSDCGGREKLALRAAGKSRRYPAFPPSDTRVGSSN